MQGQWGPPGQMPPGAGYAGGQQGYAPPGYGQSYGQGDDYEFNDAENQVIGGASLWARVLAIVLFVNAALALLNCNPFSAAFNIVVGIYFLTGGNSLDAVVKTQGNDVANMMQALTKLGTAFKIRVIATIVGLSLILLAFCGLVLIAVASR